MQISKIYVQVVSSNANALDNKHFSSNAGDAMRGQGETKYRKNKASGEEREA